LYYFVELNKIKRAGIFLRSAFTAVGAAALIVAAFVLGYWAIHAWHPSYFTQYENHREPGLIPPVIRFLKQLGWMVLFSIAIVILVAVVCAFQALFGKWRKLRIFISYEHRYKTFVPLLQEELNDRWIQPSFLPFGPADHDTLIEKVRHSIKLSDMLLVLPGSERSFVDAEVLAASTLEKPIIILKVTDDQRTPDTGFKGYPIFDVHQLKKHQYQPLKRFVRYVGNAAVDVMKNFFRATTEFYEDKGLFVIVGFFACDTLSIMLSPEISFFVNHQWEEKARDIIYWIFTISAVVIFAISYIGVVIEKMRAIAIVRQKIRTGDLTLELLSKGLNTLGKDKAILDCIVPAPMPATYQ